MFNAIDTGGGLRVSDGSISDGAGLPEVPQEKLIAEKCRRSFKYFLRQAWPTAEPGSPLIHGWHMDVICDHIQACVEGRIKNLIIAIPPRHSKSTIVSVLFPAWLWIRDPGRRTLFVSFAARLSDRDSRKCRNLIESKWFQDLFSDKFQLCHDSNTIRRFDNDKGGMRFATSVDGTLTGEGANFVVADDMHNLSEIMSDIKREKANEIWDTTLQSRLNPPVEEGHFIIIAQRGHSSDLIGHVKTKEEQAAKDGKPRSYTILELPAEYDPSMHCETFLGHDENGEEIWWSDPRTVEGELLWPAGCPQDYLDRQKVNLGTFAYNAQYQQRPVPKEGGTFKLEWFPRYLEHEVPNVAAWDDSCISVDMNFGTTKGGEVANLSWVVATAWARAGRKFYLLDMIRGQWQYTESKRRLVEFIFLWGMIFAIYVENKANGPAIMDDLQETEGMMGIIPIDPKEFGGDKLSRANAITPICEAKNVYLPHETETEVGRRIMDAVLLELGTFPLGATNDIVDSITQAINKMRLKFIAMGVGVGGAGVSAKDAEESLRKQLAAAETVETTKVPDVEYPVKVVAKGPRVVLNGRVIGEEETNASDDLLVSSYGIEDGPSNFIRERTFGPGQGFNGSSHDQLLGMRQVHLQEQDGLAIRSFWRGML